MKTIRIDVSTPNDCIDESYEVITEEDLDDCEELTAQEIIEQEFTDVILEPTRCQNCVHCSEITRKSLNHKEIAEIVEGLTEDETARYLWAMIEAEFSKPAYFCNRFDTQVIKNGYCHEAKDRTIADALETVYGTSDVNEI